MTVRKHHMQAAALVNCDGGKNIAETRRAHRLRVDQLEGPGGAAIRRSGDIHLALGAIEKHRVHVAVVWIYRDVALVARLHAKRWRGDLDGRAEGDSPIGGFDYHDAVSSH